MKKIKAVFFDFDGVLIDSLPVMKKAWQSTQKSHYLKQDFKEFSKYIGIPFNSILENLKIDIRKHSQIQESYSKEARKNINLIQLNPYAENILFWLKNNNIKIAVVTSKDLVRTNELIDYLNIKVDLIVTPEKTSKGKPHPEPLFFAGSQLSTEMEEALFIGDMLTDMQAAYRANCRYLHYLCGYQQFKLNSFTYGGNINSLWDIQEYINLI